MGKIQYKIKQYKNSKSEYNNYYYPRAVMISTLTTDELAERIQAKSALTIADVKACLAAFSEELRDALCESKRVVLDGIGTFSVGIKSKKMVRNAQAFSPREHIAGFKVNFLPQYTLDMSGRRVNKLIANAGVVNYGEYAEGVNDTAGGSPNKVGLVTAGAGE